jgi:hypothetical protein
METRNELIQTWYESQDDITRWRIDSAGKQFRKGISERKLNRKLGWKKTGFGEKSQLELVYVLSRFLNGVRE